MSILSTLLIKKNVCLALCLEGFFVVIFGVGFVLVNVRFVQNVLPKAGTTYKLPGAFPCRNVVPRILVN